MREPQDKEINGVVYTVRPLSGFRGVTFLPRLNKVLGPAVASFLSAGGLKGDGLGEALKALGEKLDEKEMEAIARTLLDGATFQPKDGTAGGVLLPVFDLHMQGRPEVAYQLLVFALEVNYSGFFPGLGGLLAAAKAKASASISPKPAPPSGPAGAS